MIIIGLLKSEGIASVNMVAIIFTFDKYFYIYTFQTQTIKCYSIFVASLMKWFF